MLYEGSESVESIVLEARASPSISERLETRIYHPAVVRCKGAHTDELDFSESDGKVKTRICRLRLEVDARTGGKCSEVWTRHAPSLAWLVTPDLGTLEEVLPKYTEQIGLPRPNCPDPRQRCTDRKPATCDHALDVS